MSFIFSPSLNFSMLRAAFIAALSISCAALMAAPAFADTKTQTHGFTSSKVCGECHKDIHEAFGRSLHSLSYTNPIFQMAYAKSYLETKGSAKEKCLKCHAPTVLSTRDYDVSQSITSEGVTCDFCHSVDGVDLSAKSPFKLDVGGKKRASLKDAKSPAHDAAYNNWFNKSEMCAPCHEITSSHGVKTSSTYSEWKQSDYAMEKVQCQGCHMPEVKGKTASASVKSNGKIVHDHSLSHNMEIMKGAVKLEIARMGQGMGDRFVVDVNVTNVKAGHSIPTGTQPRELVIEATVKDSSGRSETQRQTLGKKLAGKSGKVIEVGGDACVAGVKIVENTSLKSKETRQVRFMFGIAPSKDVTVSAVAYLSYSPAVAAVEQVKIPLGAVAK